MVVKSNIILKKYSWTKNKTIFVTGFTWLKGKYLAEMEFAEYLTENTIVFEDFKKIFQLLNGQFAVIVEHDNEIWAAASHTWSYPVFYRTIKGKILISDEPQNLLVDELPFTTNHFSEIYFLTFGVTPLSNTLIDDIFQIQPGEIIRFKKSYVKTEVSLPLTIKGNDVKDNITENELGDFLVSAFEKYYHVIKDKQVLLPLTRGYDSRLLACLLKKFGHRNVICATWGRSGSNEVGTAKQVAKKLGFRHYFTDYSKIVGKDFMHSNDFSSYVNYAGHWSSMPFLYEYFGVKELKEKKIIDESTIALPGHPGDFIRGDHLGWDVINGNCDYVVSKIISTFGTTYALTRPEKKVIQDYITANFFEDKGNSMKEGYELWDFKERQCKFIGNSSQVYSFFGINSLMPLFDLDVITFFRNMPDKQKIDQNLYYSTLEKYFFNQCNVGIDLKIKGQTRKYSNFKEGILKLIPYSFKKLYYPHNDEIYYREITNELRTSNVAFEFKHPARPNAYNSYIVQWYLFSLQLALSNRNNRLNTKN
ncbi:MAG: hypothetical protein JXR61_10700 [Prolixibacteraceae bacterium]|nr:hypothetical protein [Prolixibacteraceae bacterium]